MSSPKEAKNVAVGKVQDFAVQKIKVVEIEGRQVGIVHMKNGEFRAVLNHCPHKGAPVCKGFISGTALPSAPGELIYGKLGEILVCPWHGYEFDLNTGEALYQSNGGKLRMFPVSILGDTVTVAM